MGDATCLRKHRQHQRLRNRLCIRAEVDVAEQTGAVEKTGPDFKPLKDIQAIMDVLPHRCVFFSNAAVVYKTAFYFSFQTAPMYNMKSSSSASAAFLSC